MDGFARQSTARTVKIGPFVDSTDGATLETALTISQADVRLSKNGGNMAQKNDASSCSHDELGVYDCALNATDTNTLGNLRIDVWESGALITTHNWVVLPANVYDSLISGTDLLDVNVEQWNGTDVPAEHTAGYPIITVKDGTGTGEINSASGRVDANVLYWNGAAVAAPHTAGYPVTTHKVGTGTGELNSSGGTMPTNASSIGGSSVAGTAAGIAYQGVITGTAVTGTLSATQATTSLSGYRNDAFNGRTLTFVTGARSGEQTTISDYVESSGLLTFAALTGAPTNGDIFFIA